MVYSHFHQNQSECLQTNTSTLIKKLSICEKLGGVQPNYIDHLEKTDPTFPKKIKFGNNKQSACFYVEAEINEWIETKKAARVQAAANDAEA